MGRTFDIKTEGETLLKYHLDNGGLPPEGNRNLEGEDLLYHIISTAMRHLKSDGRANMIEHSGMCEIFPEGRRVFGIGSEIVYCFYDPRDRQGSRSREAKNYGHVILEVYNERLVEERVREAN